MDESSQNTDQHSTQATDKNWLIRSSTRILGPYTLSEVTQLLASKQVSIIDEIRQPQVRWTYIRENKLFLDLVRDLRRDEENAVENTMTMTATLSNQTMTKTDLITHEIDDLTPTPDFITEKLSRPAVGLKDLTGVTEVTAKPHVGLGKSFGSFQDDRMRERLERKAQRMKWIISGVAAVCLVALVVTFLSKGHKKVADVVDLTTLALKYKNIGLYDRALDSYNRIQLTREPEFELQFQMAPLLISEDRQSLLGRRILEKALLSEGRSREDLLDSHIGIALTFMQEGELKEAENYLQKAKTFEPNNTTAQTNLAIIQLKKGNYIDGAHELDALAKRSPSSNLLLALRAIAWIEAARTTIDANALLDVYNGIRSRLVRPTYLGQELSLLGINIANILKDPMAQAESLNSFLNQVPFKSSQYLRNPMIDGRMLQWEYLAKYCNDALNDSKDMASRKAARALCFMEVNRDEDANRLISEALSERPKDPLLRAIEASYLMKVGRGTDALALLKMPDMQSLPLTQQLSGTICMQLGKVDCAKIAYKAIYAREPENIYALYGLAWVALQESQRNQAYELAKTGLQNEAGYLPLIDLRDRLDSQ